MMGKKELKTIIFLNGTSSSGKSTIAKELKNIIKHYEIFSLDGFTRNYKKYKPSKLKEMSKNEALNYMVGRFHDEIAKRQKIQNQIVDHVLHSSKWSIDCNRKLDLNVVLVGVMCPLDIVIKREKDRGDRKIGTSSSQFSSVHKNKRYDLTIDTSKISSDEGARRILSFLNNKELDNKGQKFWDVN